MHVEMPGAAHREIIIFFRRSLNCVHAIRFNHLYEDNLMNNFLKGLVVSAGVLSSTTAFAARQVEVDITNLTNGIYFTPLLVVAHPEDEHLFQVGTGASGSLQAMAEGGDLSGLIHDIETVGGDYVADPAGGLLGPGETATAILDIRGRNEATTNVSVVGMLLPTNDGFVGLDAAQIPKRNGVYTFYLNGYDAGTELNDEIINGGGTPGTPGIPVDPGGHGGTGGLGIDIVNESNLVHVHPGVIGDMDTAGGISDVDSRVHRWLNPVARVEVRVSRD